MPGPLERNRLSDQSVMLRWSLMDGNASRTPVDLEVSEDRLLISVQWILRLNLPRGQLPTDARVTSAVRVCVMTRSAGLLEGKLPSGAL